MAVYQFQLSVIPKSSVESRYGEIPEKLYINHDGWNKFWKDRWNKKDNRPNFEDARTINWWSNVEIEIEELIIQVDKCIDRDNWESDNSIYWKGKSKLMEDNDASLILDAKTGKVKEFGFRIDLRDHQKFPSILENMLKICERFDCLVFDAKGNLMQPNLNSVSQSLIESNAVKFLTDPKKFLDNIK